MTTETKKLPLIDSSILIPRKEKSLKPTLDVFFCFDDAFCLPTGISALSVLKNNKDLPLNIHLVGVDISEQNLGYFRKLDCAPSSEVLFHADLNLQDKLAAVVLDIKAKDGSSVRHGRRDFNSGMMLINVKPYVESDIALKTLTVLENNLQYKSPDQMALNDALEERRIILPKKFNFIQELTVHGEQDESRPTDSVIVHYANRSKPWTEAFSTNLYQKYYSASPWRKFPKDLVYKKDPNSIKKYALWQFKNKEFSKFNKLLLIYLSVLLERKRRKFSKQFSR